MDFDFGYNGGDNVDTINNPDVNNNDDVVTDIDTGKIEHDVNGVPADDLVDDTKTSDAPKKEDKVDENNKGSLEVGTAIEVGDETYTVASNGDLVDANGNVFKQASEVDAWLKEFDSVEEDTKDSISISSIQ